MVELMKLLRKTDLDNTEKVIELVNLHFYGDPGLFGEIVAVTGSKFESKIVSAAATLASQIEGDIIEDGENEVTKNRNLDYYWSFIDKMISLRKDIELLKKARRASLKPDVQYHNYQ